MIVIEESSPPKELLQRMYMDASTVSRNIKRMCQKDWIELIARG